MITLQAYCFVGEKQLANKRRYAYAYSAISLVKEGRLLMTRAVRDAFVLCFAAMVMLLASSCASMMLGGTQRIPINSVPPGAAVKVINAAGIKVGIGTTPYAVTVDRGSGYFAATPYRIVVEKQGYAPVEVTLQPKANNWYIAGNIVTCFVGWLIVDPLTGAMWTLMPEEVGAKLQKHASLIKSANGITVILKDQVPPQLMKLARAVRM